MKEKIRKLFRFAVISAGAFLLFRAYEEINYTALNTNLSTGLLFLAAMIAAELSQVNLGKYRVSSEFGLLYSMIFIFHHQIALIIKVISAFLSEIYYRVRSGNDKEIVSMSLFNTAQYVLSFLSGIYTYMALKKYLYNPYQNVILTEMLIQGMAIFCYYFTNMVLVNTYLFFDGRKFEKGEIIRLALVDLSSYFALVPGGILIILFNNLFQNFIGLFLGFFIYFLIVYIYRLYFDLVSLNDELTALYDIGVSFISTLNEEDLVKKLMNAIKILIPRDVIVLFLYKDGKLVPEAYEGVISAPVPDKEGQELLCKVFYSGKGEIIKDITKCKECTKYFGDGKRGSALLVPLVNKDDKFGVLMIGSRRKGIYKEKHLKIISIISHQAAAVMTNVHLFLETKEMAITDSLTQLYNRRYLFSEFKKISGREDYKEEISIIIFDIDYFKQINDEYGHLIGDEILKKVALCIKNNVRENDIVCRYGGEEFVVILPNMGCEEAFKVAERIRKIIERTEMAKSEDGLGIYVTVSAGVSSISVEDDMERFLKKADEALLFGAKRMGRNRVVNFKNIDMPL